MTEPDTHERWRDPTVAGFLAGIIRATIVAPDCRVYEPLTPCAEHLAQTLVEAMRNEHLVVLTVEAADEVLAHHRKTVAERIAWDLEHTQPHLLVGHGVVTPPGGYLLVDRAADIARSHATEPAIAEVGR